MLLSHDDAAQFFRLLWGVQFYVNQQQHLLPDVNSYETFARLDMIKSFKHKGLEDFFYTGKKKGIKPEHTDRL